jgi:hypothetical protein
MEIKNKLKGNIFICIYFLLTFGYIFINEYIFKNILKSFEFIGFNLILVSVLYSVIFNNRYKKQYIILNLIILIMVIIICIFNMPKFTYFEAQKIIGHEKEDKGNIIESNTIEYKGRVGLKHLNIRPGRNILVDGDYLVYLYNKINGKIEWYRFNAIEGTYKLYATK